MIYVVTIYILHCFQKKTEATTKRDKEIDTQVRHVTRADANLFLELGFPADEAQALLKSARRQIDETRQIKEALMAELARWIAENGLCQEDAAAILHVTRPRISDVVNKN